MHAWWPAHRARLQRWGGGALGAPVCQGVGFLGCKWWARRIGREGKGVRPAVAWAVAWPGWRGPKVKTARSVRALGLRGGGRIRRAAALRAACTGGLGGRDCIAATAESGRSGGAGARGGRRGRGRAGQAPRADGAGCAGQDAPAAAGPPPVQPLGATAAIGARPKGPEGRRRGAAQRRREKKQHLAGAGPWGGWQVGRAAGGRRAGLPPRGRARLPGAGAPAAGARPPEPARARHRFMRSVRSVSWRLYSARSMSVMRATPASMAACTTAAATSTARRSSKGRGMM
jgi:hypothetical protein